MYSTYWTREAVLLNLTFPFYQPENMMPYLGLYSFLCTPYPGPISSFTRYFEIGAIRAGSVLVFGKKLKGAGQIKLVSE